MSTKRRAVSTPRLDFVESPFLLLLYMSEHLAAVHALKHKVQRFLVLQPAPGQVDRDHYI